MVALHISGVGVNYGARRIVHDFGCDALPASSLTAVLGPNAAGKSTLIKAIAGVHAHAGEVALDVGGNRVRGRELRKRVGYVPQDLPRTAALRAYETVLIAARRAVKDPEWAAAKVMEDLGIAHLAERYVGELSGGQRQMVGVAQALVTQPEVLVLDEPTSALDLRRQLALLDYVGEWVRARSAVGIVVIHDINLAARYADNLVVMKDGRLHAQGAPREVLHPELIEQVYGVEAEVLSHRDIQLVAPLRAM